MSAREEVVSEEILEKLRSRVDSKQRLEDTFNELASKEAIRNFADGIGDPNPLWCDEEYSKKTRYGDYSHHNTDHRPKGCRGQIGIDTQL